MSPKQTDGKTHIIVYTVFKHSKYYTEKFYHHIYSVQTFKI